MFIRNYTPTSPLREQEDDGSFDLVVKIYFPDRREPGRVMSKLLGCMPIEEEIGIRGPTGDIVLREMGNLRSRGRRKHSAKSA